MDGDVTRIQSDDGPAFAEQLSAQMSELQGAMILVLLKQRFGRDLGTLPPESLAMLAWRLGYATATLDVLEGKVSLRKVIRRKAPPEGP